MKTDDVFKFDKFLSENLVQPAWAIMHSKIWNGYWYIKRTNRFFRWLGRKLKNKYIYWLGFQVIWISGLKENQAFVDWGVGESDEEVYFINKREK